MASGSHRYNPHATNPIYHVGWGIRFFYSGLAMIFRHPALLGLSLIPIVVTVALLLSMAFGITWLFGQWIAGAFDEWLRDVVLAAVFVAAVLVAFFLYLPVARVVLAPFAEALSRKTHAISTGVNYRSDLNWWRAIREGLKLALLHVLIGIAALGIGIIFPPIGAPAGIAIAVFLCGLDFFDIPLSARGLPLGRKLKVIFGNKALALGFGIAAYLMLLVPGLNLLSLPVGVVGATLLTDQLDKDF
ncbi:MAG: EI24 domain-containing protein [Blastocatellia bacterium]